MTVGEICTRTTVTAHPEETLIDAARRMRDRHVGDLVVVADAGMRPAGILTDRDIVVSAIAQSPDKLGTLLVGDVMNRELVTVRMDDDLDGVLKKMRTHGVRRLPVVALDGRLEGVVTFDDVVEVMAAEFGKLAAVIGREQKREREERL